MFRTGEKQPIREKSGDQTVLSDATDEPPCCTCCRAFGAWSGLQCCCCHYTSGEVLLGIAPNKDRFCTDMPCLLGFFLVALANLALMIVAFGNENSQPSRLALWSDYNGDFCSPYQEIINFTDVTISGRYAAWPDIRMLDIRICLDQCNHTITDGRIVTPSFSTDLRNIELFPDSDVVLDVSGYDSDVFLNWACIPTVGNVSDFVSADLYITYQTFTSATTLGLAQGWNIVLNDFLQVWPMYIACGFSALILAVAWGYGVMYCGRVIVWISLFFMIAGITWLGGTLIVLSHYASDYGYEDISTIMWWAGVILLIIDLMLLLAVLFMYSRIMLAIELVKETYRAMNSVRTMFIYPALPLFWFGGYFVYWMFGAAAICSITVTSQIPFPEGYTTPYYPGGATLQSKLDLPTSGAEYTKLEFDTEWQRALFFHFFMLLWVVAFIGYHSYMVIAGVYAEWYFSDWKDDKETIKHRGSDAGKHRALSKTPILGSFWRVCRYHLGTVAFASLTIAVVTALEYVLVYVESKFKGVQECPLKGVMLGCVHCCMRCVKCIVNRINKDGLIVSAVYGWPFCASSLTGLSIIIRNVLRAAMLSWVSGYLEWLGRISMVALNVAVILTVTRAVFEVQLLLLTAIVALVITWCVIWLYLELYEVGIRVIFICFLIDEERNKGGNMKASKRLKKIIGEQIKVPQHHLQSTMDSGLNAEFISEGQRRKHTVTNGQFTEIGDVEMAGKKR